MDQIPFRSDWLKQQERHQRKYVGFTELENAYYKVKKDEAIFVQVLSIGVRQ